MKNYKLKEGIVYQDVGEEGLLLNSETEEVFSLDAVAREIWLAVQRTNSVDGAVAEVLPLYKVDAETLRRDVEALLQSIAKQAYRVASSFCYWRAAVDSIPGLFRMNRFAVFWQSDGAPPEIETLPACGDELARSAGAPFPGRCVSQPGVCRGLLVIPFDR